MNKDDGVDPANAGPEHPIYNQRFRPTPEQANLTDHVRVNVGPTHGDPNKTQGGGQPVGGAAALDNSNVAPAGNKAADGQVSIDTQK